MHGDWVVLALDVVAASVLINAGLVKQVSPGQLAAALNELRRGRRDIVGDAAVRAAGGLEIAIGCALLVSASRVPASAAATAIGLCFASLGVAGRLAGSTEPCGCAGGYGGTPLGLANVAIGLALVPLLPLNVLVDLAPGRPAAFGFHAVVAATVMLLLTLWTNRELALSLLRPPVRQDGT